MSAHPFLALSPWLSAGAVLLMLAVVASLLWSALQRLRILERRVREAPRTEDLDSRLTPVHDALAGLPALQADLEQQSRRLSALPEPVDPDAVAAVQARCQELQTCVDELTRKVEMVARQLARQDLGAESVDESWQERLRRSLEAEGYDRVRVLTEGTAEPTEEDRFRVGVEARRRGVSYKGAVILVDGRLVEVALKPAYEAFP